VTSRITVKLTGPEAELGRVSARDVARLLLGFERAVARAAAGIVGRRPGLAGRRGRAVESATRLVLDSIKKGSVTAILDLPQADAETDAELDLDDIGLGAAALQETFETLSLDGGTSDVADALARLAEELDIGGRFDAIVIEGSVVGRMRTGTLDRGQSLKLRRFADGEESVRRDALYGVLFEANFERRSAQLRLPSGQSVTVTFPEALDDEVHEALRERSQLEGIVRYDAATAEATSVELRSVTRVEQRELEFGNAFWIERSVAELAGDQGIQPLTDPTKLRDDEASDDEVTAFLNAIGR
jgi:hypothetical protein